MRGVATFPFAAAILLACTPAVEPQPAIQAAETAPVAEPASSLWGSQDVLDLRLEAPLAQLIEKGRRDADFAVPARVRVGGSDGRMITVEQVKLSTRGHTSLRESECEFPKLELDFSGAKTDGSPFAGMKSVKLGTHCGDGQDAPGGKYGRWPNQKAAHREAFVYRALDALGIPTLKARAARIAYVQTDRPDDTIAPFTRDAMLLEDEDEAIKRLGARGELPDRQFGSAPSVFAVADIARIAFGQALIGNFDWCLRMHPRDTYRCNDTTPIWNVLGLVRSDATALPLIYDFDLAGMVTGRHIWFNKVFNRAFADSEAEIEVLAQVQRTRSLFPRDVLDATRRELVARKAAAYDALAGSPIDPDGRAAARSYMDSFFKAIDSDEAFYRPVIVAPTPVFADAQGSRPACSGNAAIGTPVSEPLETAGDKSRVVVLDALWHWAEKCEALRLNPVWVPTAAISRNYPSK